MSDTPRTDELWSSGPTAYKTMAFAQKLERELAAAQEKIARLRAQLAEAQKHDKQISSWKAEENLWQTENETLRAQLAEAQRDAERYRWLRVAATMGVAPPADLDNATTPQEIDTAIDAAIEKERGNG